MVAAVESYLQVRVTFSRLRQCHRCVSAISLHYYLLYVLRSSFILLYESNDFQSPEFRLRSCMFDQLVHLLLRDAHLHDQVTNESKCSKINVISCPRRVYNRLGVVPMCDSIVEDGV